MLGRHNQEVPTRPQHAPNAIESGARIDGLFENVEEQHGVKTVVR